MGSWGLKCLVADFDSFLAEIGDETMQKFKTDFANCYSDMIRHLKSKLHWQGTNEFRISDYPAGTVEGCRLDAPLSLLQGRLKFNFCVCRENTYQKVFQNAGVRKGACI